MIRYTDHKEGLKPDQLEGFFAGWPNPPSPEKHLELLEGSDVVLLAIDDDESRVVGFITALTDGVLAAYVPLLEVLPSHRGTGIGRELARRMLERLGELYMVDVVCDRELESFYSPLGMKAAHAMIIRRHDRQSGA